MKVKIKVLATQLCLTLCEAMDYSPPGSSVHGILQARILEWVAIPPSRGSSDPGTEPTPVFQADSLPSEPPGKPYKGIMKNLKIYKQVCIFVEKLEKGFYIIIIWGTFFPRSLRFRNILGSPPIFLMFLKYIII